MNRRTFLTMLPAASLIRVPNGSSQTPAGSAWYATMRRCGQLNLNERDPLTLNVGDWIDYWTTLKLDAILLNGGGILAFYPTTVPYHHRSEFLGSRDLFGELTAAAKARGIRVVARMDCNYSYDEAVRAHPEWFERNRDGSPRPHGESPWLFKTCMFSTYFSEQMPAIYREINSRYPVDGFFTNGWPSTGPLTVCYCNSCQQVYRTIGGTPPDDTDATNAVYRRFYSASMDRIAQVWTGWQRAVTEDGRASVYVGNLGGGIRTVKNVRQLADDAAWFNADHQGRSGDTPIWDCAQQGRVAQAVMNGRAITNVTGAYSNSQPTWRHVTKPAAETTMWLAQTAASGMVPWFHWLGGAPEDTRWKNTGHDFFTWLARYEPHFRNKRSIANLAVLYPQRTIAFYRSGGRDRVPTSEYLQGLYYALLEGRFFFDFIHEDHLTSDRLQKYAALLIPNAAYLEDEACEAIRAYVAGGRSLLATFETSRYTGWGEARRDFALADVFGATVDGALIGPHGNSYMRIEQPHPVTRGFDGTALLPGPETRVPIRRSTGGPNVLTVVPYYPAFPPEMVFPRTPRTDSPAAILRENGTGRVAYFAGDVDRTLWRSGNVDLSRVVQNTIRWLLGNTRAPVTIDGDGMIEAFAWQTDPGYALHILNYTNPNMMRGFVRQFYPIGPLKIAFDVMSGQRIQSVRALRAERALPFRQEGATVQVDVPSVTDYEVIALSLT
jgi:Hypothetical glycosyl hydrolase 6